ncbi:MAG: hypothetical protein L3K17_05170 [Thermoplasmata archaeon]|nr:hypothetical protein [Thermoplasmata archaeon]
MMWGTLRSTPGSFPAGLHRFAGARGLAIGLVLMVLLSGNAYAGQPTSDAAGRELSGTVDEGGLGPIVPLASTPYNTTLNVSSSSVNLSSLFWGTTVNNEVRTFRGETNAVNATPARVLVWPGAMAGEDYDPLTNTHYDTYSGTPKTALTNESQFVQMCKATHCIAIVQVPAEIDNPSLAEAVVNYTEVNLSFTPAYWMIGNEPELWGHWKVAWKNWPSDYTTGPTPTQFGNEVVAYVKVIREVDNTTPILGLPASGCTCGSYTFDQWISGVIAVTGNKIQAVAFHEYPAGWLGTGNGSLEAFYGTIQSAANIPTRMVAARAAVKSSCPGCNVSVFISELGAALSWSTYGPYAIGFSGPLSLASQITQAMDDNLTNIDLFATELATTNSWFDPTGHPRADYTLYTAIFDHLGTQAFQANLSGLGHTLYGIDTLAPSDHGRQDLLVVNDNITKTITFTPRFAGSPANAPVEAWYWNGSIHSTKSNDTIWVEPYTPTPIPQDFASGLPSSYTIPPQSMVLFESYPSGASYVQVVENGVPSPTAWYASVGSQFYTTTASNISLLLPSGSYAVASVPIPLPIGGKELNPSERLAPFTTSPAQVAGKYTNLTISFLNQWEVNASASPVVGGTVTPDVGWWNSNQSLNLTATPALGYAFQGWSGWGPGSYNGTNRSTTIVPMGRITEKARFAVGNPVDLIESGLPGGTNWSVTIRGITTYSSSGALLVYELVGIFGYTVDTVAGYRAVPRTGAFTVSGGSMFVDVRFVPLTPPPPTYAVTFQISGLPIPTAVSITVRDVTLSTELTDLEFPPLFPLINGSYAYHLSDVPGYHANVSEKTFLVNGGALTVEVPFVATVYAAVWEANGTRSGLNWSVVVNGQPIVATSAWVSTSLPNGSYFYAIELPANFTVNPQTGQLLISGYNVQLSLSFALAMFSTRFTATGAASTGWSVRLGDTTENASGTGPSFMEANGTYTWDVHAPDGYYAIPSHGNLTVAGQAPVVQIQFHLSSNQPSAALVAALTSGAVSASFWIGLSMLVGFVSFRGLRRRDGRTR